MTKMKMIFATAALAGTIALTGGTTAMAATPTATTTPATATTSTTTAPIGYTFDHNTTVSIYNLAITGASDAAVDLCNAVIPAPLGEEICPALGSLISNVAPLGAPGPTDKLYIGLQFGWPPVLIQYVH